MMVNYGRKSLSGLAIMVAAVTISCGPEEKTAPPPPPPSPSPRPPAVVEIPATTLPAETNNVQFFVDGVQPQAGGVQIVGWAFITGPAPSAAGSTIFVVLDNAGAKRVFATTPVVRTDVADYFKNPEVQSSGFSVLLPTGALPKGQYRLGLYVKRGQDQALQFTDKTVAVN